MEVNFDATEPVDEEIADDKQVIPFAQYAASRAIDHFMNKKFTEAATVCYKAHCLLDQLRFLLPAYPQFASVYSFANIFLASAESINNEMVCERFFQTPLNNTRDAFFDPLYSFTAAFTSIPAEFCHDLENKISETLFGEVKRILMRQEKAGKIAISGNRIMFKIEGFEGEFQWSADFKKNLQEPHQLINVEDYDRLKIIFEEVEAHPADEELANFVGSLSFELDDKYGEKGEIFIEIKEKINELIIIRQLERIVEEEIPEAFEGQLFAFQRIQSITLDAIKTHSEKPVYALVFRFPKETVQLYTSFAEKNGAVFASKTTEFADLICERSGKPTIRLDFLKKLTGPSDYIIFYFRENYDDGVEIRCGQYLAMSFQQEDLNPEIVINRLARELINIRKSEYHQELETQFKQLMDLSTHKIILLDEYLLLCIGRLNIRIIDNETVQILDFLTGEDLWAMYDGLANSGLVCIAQLEFERIDVRRRLHLYLEEHRLLFLQELIDLNCILSEIRHENIVFNLFYEEIEEQIARPKLGYFYEQYDEIFYVEYYGLQTVETVFFYDEAVDGFLRLYKEPTVVPQEFFADSSAKVAKIHESQLLVADDKEQGVSVIIKTGESRFILMPPTLRPSILQYEHCKNQIEAMIRKIHFLTLLANIPLNDPFDCFTGATEEQEMPYFPEFKTFSQRMLLDYLASSGMSRFIGLAGNKDLLVSNIVPYISEDPLLKHYLLAYYCYLSNEQPILSTNLELSMPRQRYAPYAPFFEDQDEALRCARGLSENELDISIVETLLSDLRNLIFVGIETEVVLCFNDSLLHVIVRQEVEDLRRAIREEIVAQLQELEKKAKQKTELDLVMESHTNIIKQLELVNPLFGQSPEIFLVSKLENDLEEIGRTVAKFQAARSLALREVLNADDTERGIRSLVSYMSSIVEHDAVSLWDESQIVTHDQVLYIIIQEEFVSFQHRIHTFLLNQTPLQSYFQFKEQISPLILRLREAKAPEAEHNRLRFETTSTTFAEFLIDLGAIENASINLLFDPPSISLSLNTHLRYENMEIDVSKSLKSIVRRFSCGMFFYNSNEVNLFIAPNLAVFDEAKAKFNCGERSTRCECVHCVVSEREILNYQNKCRCGDHHCVPFGHGMLQIPMFKDSDNPSQYLDAIVKVEKIASVLNFIEASYELCGTLRLFLRADSSIAGRDSDNVKFLTIKGFDWLRINASYDNTSCLEVRKEKEYVNTNVNYLVSTELGFDGVVFGIVCYGWDGEIMLLKDGKWAKPV